MTIIGKAESLWRYPVKSMRGAEMSEIFLSFAGVFGDRCYAFKDAAARVGFPYLNANVQQKMLQYQPRFRYAERAKEPPNRAEAEAISPDVTFANPDAENLALDVIAPSGKTLAIDDPQLIERLGANLSEKHQLSLVRSDRALTDCRPISIIGLQTVRQIESELDFALDKRRFRANIYLDFAKGKGFAEDDLVNRRVRIGAKAELMILERDPRCKMISLDPETGEHNPEVLRKVARAHGNYAGVYAAVLVEGMITKGDAVEIADK